MDVVDSKLGSKFKKEEAKRMIEVALLCTYPSPALRPSMSTVVSMLEGRTRVLAMSLHPSDNGNQSKFQALTDYMDNLRDPYLENHKTFSSSSCTTTRNDSSSTSDYPVASNQS